MSSNYNQASKLVWLDLEMTGLNVETNVILEIASLITDNELNLIAEGPDLVVSQPEEALARMDQWNREHHSKSGLLDQVKQSLVSVEEAEATTLAFISRHVEIHTSPLCGNSVWQDRRFLARYMPTLDHYLHYRIIDVSTLKELAHRWGPPELIENIKKNGTHRAMDDIKESVNELLLYRQQFIKLRDPQ